MGGELDAGAWAHVWQVFEATLVPVLTAAVGWLGGKIRGSAKERREREQESAEERDQTRSAVRLLLFYRLHDIRDEYAGRAMSAADKHQAEELYQTYHAMGGNGTGTQLYKEIMGLPTE